MAGRVQEQLRVDADAANRGDALVRRAGGECRDYESDPDELAHREAGDVATEGCMALRTSTEYGTVRAAATPTDTARSFVRLSLHDTIA